MENKLKRKEKKAILNNLVVFPGLSDFAEFSIFVFSKQKGNSLHCKQYLFFKLHQFTSAKLGKSVKFCQVTTVARPQNEVRLRALTGPQEPYEALKGPWVSN